MDWSAIDRHEGRAAFSFSGGKDSTLLLWAAREAGLLGRVTVYHLDTGDLLPEMRDHVAALEAWCPSFVRVQSDPVAWAAIHGEPTDLLPYSAHPVGRLAGQGGAMVSRYDCCFANLMTPIYERIKADGNTLIIRGTRAADMPRLPVATGQSVDGMEMLYPIQDWSDQDVFDFIEANGIPLPSLYGHFRQAPECATCPAWWGEGRGAYLRAHHPELLARYRERLAAIMPAMSESIMQLNAELRAIT